MGVGVRPVRDDHVVRRGSVIKECMRILRKSSAVWAEKNEGREGEEFLVATAIVG